MRQSEKIDQLAAALIPALGRMKNPRPDARGQVRGRTDYTYVSLPNLLQHVRDVFKDVGLAVTQDSQTENGDIAVLTRIMHLSGQWVEYGPLMFHVQGTHQEVGSALSYAKRYALAAAVGVAGDEDDDGTAASRSPAFSSTQGGRDDEGATTSGHSDVAPSHASEPPRSEGTSATGPTSLGEGGGSPVADAIAAYGGKAHLLRAARTLWDVRSIDDITSAMVAELMRTAPGR